MIRRKNRPACGGGYATEAAVVPSSSRLAYALPAGLAGAMMPDLKFARYFLPESAVSWVLEVGDRFHAPFHAAPTTVAIGLTLEIVCTMLLLGALLILIRRADR
jgi:hypothetical protein